MLFITRVIGGNMKDSMTLEEILKHLNEYDIYYKKLGKLFCKKAKYNTKMQKAIDIYCDFKNPKKCFLEFYKNKKTAEEIAEELCVDRRTVFKHIDSEILYFGEWLDNQFSLSSYPGFYDFICEAKETCK